MPSFLFMIWIAISLPVIGGAKNECQDNDCDCLEC